MYGTKEQSVLGVWPLKALCKRLIITGQVGLMTSYTGIKVITYVIVRTIGMGGTIQGVDVKRNSIINAPALGKHHIDILVADALQ